jgi:hypothetical protein
MSKTEYMVYWTNDGNDTARSGWFDDMTKALNFMQFLREKPDNKFVSMASECADNVGKIGVDSVVDGVCPDGEAFLGRTSRHGMQLKRDR